MGLNRTVEPDQEPIDLEETKAHLRCDLDVEDELVASLIEAARTAAETYTLRSLVTQTWQLSIDYGWPTSRGPSGASALSALEALATNYGCPRIRLPRPPIASVSFVKYIDLNGVLQTLAPDQYIVHKLDTGDWVIEPGYRVIWPLVRPQPAAILVEYVAGTAVAQVPAPIKSGIKLVVEHLYSNRGITVVGQSVVQIPLTMEWLFDPYRDYPTS